jgi:spermidine synthase
MEISDTMWPGEAMSLRVKEILHVEKSKYQDVSHRGFCQVWLGQCHGLP